MSLRTTFQVAWREAHAQQIHAFPDGERHILIVLCSERHYRCLFKCIPPFLSSLPLRQHHLYHLHMACANADLMKSYFSSDSSFLYNVMAPIQVLIQGHVSEEHPTRGWESGKGVVKAWEVSWAQYEVEFRSSMWLTARLPAILYLKTISLASVSTTACKSTPESCSSSSLDPSSNDSSTLLPPCLLLARRPPRPLHKQRRPPRFTWPSVTSSM